MKRMYKRFNNTPLVIIPHYIIRVHFYGDSSPTHFENANNYIVNKNTGWTTIKNNEQNIVSFRTVDVISIHLVE